METGPIVHCIDIYFEEGRVMRRRSLFGHVFDAWVREPEHPKWRFYYQIRNSGYSGSVNYTTGKEALYMSMQDTSIDAIIDGIKSEIVHNMEYLSKNEPERSNVFEHSFVKTQELVDYGIPAPEEDVKKAEVFFTALDKSVEDVSLPELVDTFRRELEEKRKKAQALPVERPPDLTEELEKRGYECHAGSRGIVFTRKDRPYAIKMEKRSRRISQRFIEDHIGKWNFLRFGGLPVPEEYGVLCNDEGEQLGIVMTAYRNTYPYRISGPIPPEEIGEELVGSLEKAERYGISLDDHTIHLYREGKTERAIFLDVEHLPLPRLEKPEYRRFGMAEVL